ncbi:MAG: methyltransferase domain-containing protein [Rhodospirillaceae bacterium]
MALGTRVMMGIPTTRAARRSTDWIDCMAGLHMPLGSSFGRVWVHDLPIAEARNRLCEQALASGAEYLFMLSDDVLPPANALLLLLDKIGTLQATEDGHLARASMITGVYWTKTYPAEPYLWRGLLKGSYRDWTAGEFFPVDFAGCDCLLIETAMLRELPRPWFSTDWTFEPGQPVSSIATEDFYFYSLARKHGYRLFADTSIQCYHEDRATGAHYGLTADMRQASGLPLTPPSDTETWVADLGAGVYTPAFGDGARIVRFDGREDARPHVRCDLRRIPEVWHGHFDTVYSGHVLEHFGRREAGPLVAHWTRLLKPGGELLISVPNLEVAARTILDHAAGGTGLQDRQGYDMAMLYGDQRGYETAYHRSGYVARSLRALLETTPGLSDVTVEEIDDGNSLLGRARFAGLPAPVALSDWWDEIRERERSECDA